MVGSIAPLCRFVKPLEPYLAGVLAPSHWTTGLQSGGRRQQPDQGLQTQDLRLPRYHRLLPENPRISPEIGEESFLRSRSTRRLSAASHCGALPACSLQLLASVPCVQAASFLHGDSSELRLPVFRHVCPIKQRTRLKLAKKYRQEAAVMHFCFQFFTIPPPFLLK